MHKNARVNGGAMLGRAHSESGNGLGVSNVNDSDVTIRIASASEEPSIWVFTWLFFIVLSIFIDSYFHLNHVCFMLLMACDDALHRFLYFVYFLKAQLFRQHWLFPLKLYDFWIFVVRS